MPRSDPFERQLYDRIRRGMIYWFNRIIRELPANDSHPGRTRAQLTRQHTRLTLRRYHERRAQGMTAAEASGHAPGSYATASRRYRQRWGGALKPGSGPWKRRLLAAHGIVEGR